MDFGSINESTIEFGWDDSKLKEIEQAKALYRQARKDGRKIVDLKGGVVEGFRSNLLGFRILEKEYTNSQFSLLVVNETGDELVVWDSSVKKEVKEAAKLFAKYLDKGCKAYAVEPDGDKGRRIMSFDADLEEITFQDKGVMSISGFAKAFGKAQILPKTRRA